MQYSIKAAAMATGVSESCLRTWERRYGVPQPARAASGRRLYADADLSLIRRMSALIDAGISAADAADAVRLESNPDVPTVSSETRDHPLVDLFALKATEFDEGWLLRIIRDSVFSNGWAPTMERIAFPALRGLGRGWVEASASVAPIQFASELLRRELCSELSTADEVSTARPLVLLACVEDESHDLGLLALALLLRQRDVRVKYLGAGIPCEDLVEAARVIGPAAVCLSATTSPSVSALNRVARKMLTCRVPAQLFVGGPGLVRQQAPSIPGIQLPQSLVAATERIAAALGEASPGKASGSRAG